ncbi:MAG: PKD domain-containing protein [Candidatus Bathyarchaeota archaeon]|nr:MAG: PKD domain-containing protein [Candidatus Bathyarchaeota archaeon]
MKDYWRCYLFFQLLIIVFAEISVVSCVESTFKIQAESCHFDHLNDEPDSIPNDYLPFIIPIEIGKRITIAPVITCTYLENDTWNPHYYPCKMAQTFPVDDNWEDADANYTYIFEDWTDYDWNDIVIDVYASILNGIRADLLLTSREAGWKNPFSLQITAEGTWIKIEWNSTDKPDQQQSIVTDGETVEVDLFEECNPHDQSLIRILVPPVAIFSWQPTYPLVGETVVFNASGSYDPDRKIEIYSWDFDQSTPLNSTYPAIIYKFASSGTHSVNLTVVDNDGLVSTILKSIKVQAIIGGDAILLDNTLVTIWRNLNILLIISFVVITILMQEKKKF